MQIAFTQRLFYGRHCYKITIQETVSQHRYWCIPTEVTSKVTWCMHNLPSNQFVVTKRRGSYDFDNQLAVWSVCVYFSDPNIKDTLLKQYGPLIHEITQPLNADHEANLTVKNVLQVRKQLIYKKYRHVIYFKYDSKGEIHKWLGTNYKNTPEVMITGTPKWCKVYTVEDSEMIHIQMCWADRIQYTKTVVCLDSTKP